MTLVATQKPLFSAPYFTEQENMPSKVAQKARRKCWDENSYHSETMLSCLEL